MNAVDTNVLLYSIDQRDLVKQARARELLRGLADGVLLWQVGCEFVASAARFERLGLTRERAWDRLRDMRAMLHVVMPGEGTWDRAEVLQQKHQVSFWDALIFAAALDAGVTTIFSEDLPGEAIPGLRVINPFATGATA
jgi:predicted nucleic acid-binding protein